MTTRTGIYPGTFDPITNGHTDIIRRALRLVDHLIIGVAANLGKKPLFTCDERVAMVKEDISSLFPEASECIDVKAFDGLLVQFAVDQGACIIIRGLRAFSDFEYEFQMTGMNARLNGQIETVFLMASDQQQVVSSKLVKEIGGMNGDISNFVSPLVQQRLRQKTEGNPSS